MSARGTLVLSANSVKFDEGVRHAIYERDGYKCAYCGLHDATGSGAKLSLDHITSLENGGESQHRRTDGDRRSNVVAACGSCNSSKQEKGLRAFNIARVAVGMQPVDAKAVRAQAAKKIDLAKGDKSAKVARVYREAGSYLDFSKMKIPDHTDAQPKGGVEQKQGPGIHHGPDGKFQPAAASRIGFARLTLSRACESLAAGDAPHAFRILAAGENATDRGPLVFTPESARLVMVAFAARGNPLAIYYEHEDQLPLEKRGGAPMRGACAAPSSALTTRGPADAPECWAEGVAWTEEAKRQIRAGERRQISPVAAFDKDTREVLEILNVSLCAEGATHNGTLLASRDARPVDRALLAARGGERSSIVDELMDQLQEAVEGGDFEKAEDIVQEMEAQGGEGMARMVKMARACMKAAKDGAAPPPMPPKPAAPAAAATKLAASRAALAAVGLDVEAFSRAEAGMLAATREANAAAKRSDRATVQTLITANRDLFDVVDEREHMSAANPDATQRHIASLSRKTKAGVVTLSRVADTTTAAKPGEGKPVKAAEEQLTVADRSFIDSFNRGERDPKKHITAADYLESKRMHGGRPPVVGVA